MELLVSSFCQIQSFLNYLFRLITSRVLPRLIEKVDQILEAGQINTNYLFFDIRSLQNYQKKKISKNDKWEWERGREELWIILATTLRAKKDGV